MPEGGNQPRQGPGCVLIGVGVVLGLALLGQLGKLTRVEGPEPKASAAAIEDPGVKAQRLAAWFNAANAPAAKCEAAGERLQRQVAALGKGAGDRTAAWQEASFARDACRDAWQAVGKAELPEGLGDAGQAAAKTAVENCATASFVRSELAEGLMTVIDGDMRPSALATVEERGRDLNAALVLCAGGYFTLGKAEGIAVEQLDGAVGAKPSAGKK